MSNPEARPGAGQEEPGVPVGPLWRNRAFRLLWTGQALSSVGSNAARVAYPLLVLALTGSAVFAGLVGTSSAVAGFVLRLPAGAWADRLDRRLAMIGCDIARALALGALTVLVLRHYVSWPLVLLAALVDEVGGVLFSPASTAALPAIAVMPGWSG
jgi:MFS family permease